MRRKQTLTEEWKALAASVGLGSLLAFSMLGASRGCDANRACPPGMEAKPGVTVRQIGDAIVAALQNDDPGDALCTCRSGRVLHDDADWTQGCDADPGGSVSPAPSSTPTPVATPTPAEPMASPEAPTPTPAPTATPATTPEAPGPVCVEQPFCNCWRWNEAKQAWRYKTGGCEGCQGTVYHVWGMNEADDKTPLTFASVEDACLAMKEHDYPKHWEKRTVRGIDWYSDGRGWYVLPRCDRCPQAGGPACANPKDWTDGHLGIYAEECDTPEATPTPTPEATSTPTPTAGPTPEACSPAKIRFSIIGKPKDQGQRGWKVTYQGTQGFNPGQAGNRGQPCDDGPCDAGVRARLGLPDDALNRDCFCGGRKCGTLGDALRLTFPHGNPYGCEQHSENTFFFTCRLPKSQDPVGVTACLAPGNISEAGDVLRLWQDPCTTRTHTQQELADLARR